jgi:hypothetical protein
MVNESLTTRSAKERLAVIKQFIPVRNRLTEKLQTRQEQKDDFVVGSEQLFKPITSATTPILGELEKITAQTKQSKKYLETLPAEIAVATAYRRRGDVKQPLAITSTPEQQQPYVTMADEEEPGATAMQPEEELLQETQQEIDDIIQQQSDIRENIPSKVFKKSTIDKIRGFDKWKEVIDFTVEHFYPDQRVKHANPGYEDNVHALDKWIRMVYLARIYRDALPPKDESFKAFSDIVKSRRDEWLQKQKQKDDGATGTSKKGDGYLGSGVVENASVTCPGIILCDISRLETLIGGKRAGNNSPEIINEAADICVRLFRGGIMDIGTYRELVDELMDGYHSD